MASNQTGGGRSSRWMYKVGLILLLVEASQCLKITLDVPQSYILSRGDEPQEELILDCDFEMDSAKSNGFVLKWKHNGLQIYQWIPVTTKPVALSAFKGHIDLDYTVSDNRFQKYRALRLINPTANFTGNYSCSVQTFEENEMETGHLQIIVPEMDFNLTFHRGNNGSMVVSCGVSDIFPKPELSLFIDESQTKNVVLSEEHGQGSYDVMLQHVLSDESKDAAISCQLSIPGTNYTKRREKMYHGAAFRTNISILQILLYAWTAVLLSSSFRL